MPECSPEMAKGRQTPTLCFLVLLTGIELVTY